MVISPEKSRESCLKTVESYIDNHLKASGGVKVEVVVDRFFEGREGRQMLSGIKEKYNAAGWCVEYDSPSPVPIDYGTLIFTPKKKD